MNPETLQAVLAAKASLAQAKQKLAESKHGIAFYTKQAAKRELTVVYETAKFEEALKDIPEELRGAFIEKDDTVPTASATPPSAPATQPAQPTTPSVSTTGKQPAKK